MSRLLPVSCFAAVLSACFSPTFEAPATNEEPGTVSEEARVCRVGAVCTADSDCCLGHFCDSSPYGSSVCSAGRANGSYCTANSQCRSQVCQGFGCVAIACASAGSDCSDTGCCAGSFCDFFGYGPTTCRPTRADGAYCYEDRQCTTQACVASMCGSAPRANGLSCSSNSHCVSGSCRNAVCAAPSACMHEGSSCEGDDDCCAGSYCKMPLSYVSTASFCVASGLPGEYCNSARECVSLSCVRHACAL